MEMVEILKDRTDTNRYTFRKREYIIIIEIKYYGFLII